MYRTMKALKELIYTSKKGKIMLFKIKLNFMIDRLFNICRLLLIGEFGMNNKTLNVAYAMLEIAQEKGETLTPMKLQKLLYYAHGWHLAIYNKPLIDEQIQAWEYGPVISSVYHRFKSFGNKAIELDKGSPTYLSCLDGEEIDLLKKVWEVYGDFSAFALSDRSHDPNGPWVMQKEKLKNGLRHIEIPNEDIREYFLKLTEE